MDALPLLRHLGDDYASRPIAAAFNWDEAASELGDGEWYLVAFRSIRRADADEARLDAFDEAAHQEAAALPGFVHYYKGPKASDDSCLSFCLWDSRLHARAAAAQPAHRAAVTLIAEMYDSYTLEFNRVTRTDGGPLTFAPYDAAEVPARPAADADVTLGDLKLQPTFRPAPAS